MAWPKGVSRKPEQIEDIKQDNPEPIQEKEVVVEQPKAEPKEVNRPVVILTELDSIISERMKHQLSNAPTIEDIEVRDLDKRTESQHRLRLPKEVEDAMISKKLTPRWLYKEKRAIDNALNVIGWILVNHVYFPELPDYLFSANGCIEAGDAILAFMPKKRADEIRELPAKKSRELVKNVPVQDLSKWEQRADHHYKPASGVAENGEDLKSTARRGIAVTPDSDLGE